MSHHLSILRDSLRPLSTLLLQTLDNNKQIINILIESGRSRSRWRLQAFRSRTSFLDIAQTVRTHLDPMLGEDLYSFPRGAGDAGTLSRAIMLVIMDAFYGPWKWLGRRPPRPGRSADTSPSRCVQHVCVIAYFLYFIRSSSIPTTYNSNIIVVVLAQFRREKYKNITVGFSPTLY